MMEQSNSTHLPPLSPSSSLLLTHLVALVLCYLIGAYSFNLLLITPIAVLLFIHWKDCHQIVKMTALLRAEYFLAKERALKTGESVQFVNSIINIWWPACSKSVTNFVCDWVEPIVEKFKFPVIVESLRFVTFNTGLYRPKFSNVRLLHQSPVQYNKHTHDEDPSYHTVFTPATMETLTTPPIAMMKNGESVFAFETDFILDVPEADLKMKAKVGSKSVGHNFDMSVESFCISGRLRIIITAKKSAHFPHVATTDFYFIAPPKPVMRCTCRMFKENIEVMNAPGIKQFMNKYIEMGFTRLLVYPGKQHVDFTPAPPAECEWEGLCRRGLAQGVLTVTLENINRNTLSTVKSISSRELNQYCKLELGSQKCHRELNIKSNNAWTTKFSFLVKNPKEELKLKLKARRKFQNNLVLSERTLPLLSLGIGEKNQEQDGLLTKTVQMSLASLQLSLSLTYTQLSRFSLLSFPKPDHVDLSGAGVLYIHVHAASNLIGHFSSKQSCDPYCIVHIMDRVILTTHTISSSFNPIWEKGVELLVPSYNAAPCYFSIYNKHTNEIIGTTELILNNTNPQCVQHTLALSTSNKDSQLYPASPALCVSVIFRPVKSVIQTRDSLAQLENRNLASCLDITTACLNFSGLRTPAALAETVV